MQTDAFVGTPVRGAYVRVVTLAVGPASVNSIHAVIGNRHILNDHVRIGNVDAGILLDHIRQLGVLPDLDRGRVRVRRDNAVERE